MGSVMMFDNTEIEKSSMPSGAVVDELVVRVNVER